MTAMTDLDILDRLRAIMQAYTGYTSANDLSVGAALTVLPSFIINPLDATWTPNGRRYLVTLNVEIIGIVSRITDITQLNNRLTAYRAAIPIVRPWVAWLNSFPRLRAVDGSDSGLASVTGVGTITSGGFGPYTYHDLDYSAFRLQLPVFSTSL